MNIKVVYVTPAGFICTCGTSHYTMGGGNAAIHGKRHAQWHKSVDKNAEITVIDYRRIKQ